MRSNAFIEDIALTPKPPELVAPWRTDQRVALLEEARNFVYDQVLPTANEHDKTEKALSLFSVASPG
jgi:hypothetical protein